MVLHIKESIWQAEARTKETRETREFIKDIRRVTRRKFTAEEGSRLYISCKTD